MDGKSLRFWCLHNPRPKMLRVHCADDSIQEITAPRPGQSWSQVANTIAALQPTLVEALDEKGVIIRATRAPEEEVEGAEKRIGADIDVPPVLSTDPETARVTHFANLLYRSHRFATEVAFAKMVELFERMDARSTSIEQRLERSEANYRRALQQQVDDAFDQAADIAAAAQQQGVAGTTGDPRQDMINMWINNAVAGWMQRNAGGGGGPPPPPPKGNGKPNGGQ